MMFSLAVATVLPIANEHNGLFAIRIKGDTVWDGDSEHRVRKPRALSTFILTA